MAWNDAEITPKGNNPRLRYDVTEDSCKVSLNAAIELLKYKVQVLFKIMHKEKLFMKKV